LSALFNFFMLSLVIRHHKHSRGEGAQVRPHGKNAEFFGLNLGVSCKCTRGREFKNFDGL